MSESALRRLVICFAVPAALVVGACSTTDGALAVDAAPLCMNPVPAASALPPRAPSCENDLLTAHDQLLVLAPHPDDEVLGFGGLISAFVEQGKPVEVVVATDGDAYCEACQFWKSGSMSGPTCTALELANFATDAVDSFAEVRHAESRAALRTLGATGPTFLGYPDTGLSAAWNDREQGVDDALRRSDFSMCDDCGTCTTGYGRGPATSLTVATLEASITVLLAATSENALVATTHWLDGHGDHAALGRFVRAINESSETPRAIALAVIHAYTPKDMPAPECWFPGPAAPNCTCSEQTCADRDPGLIASLRDYRFRPSWPGMLPDDADYIDDGREAHLCLPAQMHEGDEAVKLAAVNAFATQLGFATRTGSPPPARAGIIDCSGYLISFVRGTEAFVYFPRETGQ